MSRLQKLASLKILKMELSHNPESEDLKGKIASLESEIAEPKEDVAAEPKVLQKVIPKKEEETSEKKN